MVNIMKLYAQFLFAVFQALCLLSCTVGPDFESPDSLAVKNYASNEHVFGDQLVVAHKKLARDWWKDFHSNALNYLMTQGIKHNYSLAAMRESLAKAEAMVSASQGQLWPQATINGSSGKQQYGPATFGPVNLRIEPFAYYQIGPSASYTLDLFGGTRRTIEKQKALALYQQYGLEAAFLTLTGNIATTSIMLATLDAKIVVLHEIIRDDRKNLALIEKSFEVGSSTRSNVLSAQTQLTKDETLLPPLYQQRSVVRHTLNILLGTAHKNHLPVRCRLDDFNLPKTLPLEVPSALAHKRPDILSSEATLRAASAEVGIATARLYPNFTLSATLLREGIIPGSIFGISPNAWSLVSNVAGPLFSGGALRAQRRAAVHNYQAALANYQEIVLKAFYQVSDLLSALKQDAAECTLQKRALATARKSLDIARISFAAGVISDLEVLDAQRSYAQARLSEVNATAQRYQDTIQLYLALGGGIHP